MTSIYLDQAATSYPKAPGVAEAVYNALIEETANANRSSYASSIHSSRLLFDVRQQLSTYFSFPRSERIIFTSGATESLNMVIQGMLSEGSTVLVSPMEHNAVSRPLRALEEKEHITVEFFSCDQYGFPDIDDFAKRLDAICPDLTIFTGESNVTGAIFPIDRMMALLEERQSPYCIDGAQSTGDISVNLDQLSYGAYCCSAHKGLLAPTGLGITLLGNNIHPRPLTYGGTGSRSDSDRQPNFLPDKYESGTLNIHGLIGLQASLSYLIDHPSLPRQKQKISDYLFASLDQCPEIQLVSPDTHRGSVISFTHSGMSLSDLTYLLDRQGVAQRMGLHCAPWAHDHIGTLGTGGTMRFSTGSMTTRDEIDQVIQILTGNRL